MTFFFLHLDETVSVRIRCEPDYTYTVEGTERIALQETVLFRQHFPKLFDACLFLGVTLGFHAGEYQATHEKLPPYLAELRRRLAGEIPRMPLTRSQPL